MNSEQIQQQFFAEVGRIGDELEDVKSAMRGVVAEGHHPADVIMDTIHQAYEESDGEYRAAVKARNERLDERAARLRQDLFGAPAGAAAPAFTQALSQAANSDDDQLTALAELAATTNDPGLGRAVFAVAVQRQRADLGLPWLEANPAAREAFVELGSMPTAEELEQGLDFEWPRPSLADMRPSAHEVMAANRAEAVRRAEHAARDNGW